MYLFFFFFFVFRSFFCQNLIQVHDVIDVSFVVSYPISDIWCCILEFSIVVISLGLYCAEEENYIVLRK